MSEIIQPNIDLVKNWKPSKDTMNHGRRAYASRLCAEGKFDLAKEYCAKKGLEWPPFADKSVAITLDNSAPVAPVAVAKAEEGHGTQGEPVAGAAATVPSVPLETASSAQAERVCEVLGGCPNKRLVRIRFLDNNEYASMWKMGKRNYSINQQVKVVLDDGVVGVNAIYRELWNPT